MPLNVVTVAYMGICACLRRVVLDVVLSVQFFVMHLIITVPNV